MPFQLACRYAAGFRSRECRASGSGSGRMPVLGVVAAETLLQRLRQPAHEGVLHTGRAQCACRPGPRPRAFAPAARRIDSGNRSIFTARRGAVVAHMTLAAAGHRPVVLVDRLRREDLLVDSAGNTVEFEMIERRFDARASRPSRRCLGQIGASCDQTASLAFGVRMRSGIFQVPCQDLARCGKIKPP